MTLKEQVLSFLESELVALEDVRARQEAAGVMEDGSFKATVDLLDKMRREVADAPEPLDVLWAHQLKDAEELMRSWSQGADSHLQADLRYRADRLGEWLQSHGAAPLETLIQNVQTGGYYRVVRWRFQAN